MTCHAAIGGDWIVLLVLLVVFVSRVLLVLLALLVLRHESDAVEKQAKQSRHTLVILEGTIR